MSQSYVYVVLVGYPYEGHDIEKIFYSKDKAIEYVQTILGNHFPMRNDYTFTKTDDDNYQWHNKHSYIWLHKYEIDE